MNFPLDKQSHFLLGAATAAALLPLGLAYSIGAVLLIAIGKELYDRAHPATHTYDIKDAEFTVLGGALMLVWLTLTLPFILRYL